MKNNVKLYLVNTEFFGFEEQEIEAESEEEAKDAAINSIIANAELFIFNHTKNTEVEYIQDIEDFH